MIRFDNISKTYNNKVIALENINLTINKGEFVFLVGTSGAGKSSIIKMLLHEVIPTSGDIFINDKNLKTISNKQLPYYRRKIGMVFQDFRLIPNLTVYENVAFALRAINASRKVIKNKVPRILEQMNIKDKANAFPHEISGGEQQRVSLARALVNNPEILIADEPTGNLDPVTSSEIMNILKEINQLGTTVIMATHDKKIVDEMKKRVIEIQKGSIVRDDAKGGYDYSV